MSSSNPYPENERPLQVWCDPESLHVRLADGREVVTPLWRYPYLANATPAQRSNAELELSGVWWPEIDEGVSVKALLLGWKAPGDKAPEKAA